MTEKPEPAEVGAAPETEPAAVPHARSPERVPQPDPDSDPGPPPERAAQAASVAETRPGRFGRAGRPLAQSPFVVGFLAGLGLLLAYILYLAIQNALSILILVLIALYFAVGLNPVVTRLHRWGMPRGLAVTAVAAGVLLLMCGGLLAIIPPLVTQTNALVENLPGHLDELQTNPTIQNLNEEYEVVDRLRSAVTSENLARAAGGVFGGVQAVFGAVFGALTVFVLTIYFMANFERMRRGAYRLVPASRRERVQALGDEVLTKVGAYLVGLLIIATLAGTTSLIFLLIVGVAYPFALAVVVAICDLIPQVGATIGAVVVTLIALASESLTIGIVTFAFFVLYQQTENYLVYPRVMRRAVKVSAVAILVAALLGAVLFGLVGALMAIPAVAAIQLIGREVVLPRQDRK